MEEDRYKQTYDALTRIPCAFEKALTNHKAVCAAARHFCLADREGYACVHRDFSDTCAGFLRLLREKSRFVLKVNEVAGPLPHNMEIRIQAGGVDGLKQVVTGSTVQAEGVNGLLREASLRFGGIEKLPYDRIIQAVARFQGRARRHRKR